MGLVASGLDMRHPALEEEAPRILRPDPARRAQYDAAFERYLDHYNRTVPDLEENDR